MMKKYLLVLLLGGLSLYAWADAPVVDNSEKFKRFDVAETQQQESFAYHDEDAREDDSTPAFSDDTMPKSENERMQLLLSKFELMQRDIAELRGQVEMQSHEMAQLRGKLHVDVTSSADRQEKQADISVSEKRNTEINTQELATKAKSSSDPVDEQLSYVGAFELIKNRQYDKAIPAMRHFLATYPNGPYAANAHYWLGELLLLKQDLPGASSEFTTIIRDFADSSKLAAAKLKLGVTYAKSGQREKAREQFKRVTEEFPNTSAARLAKSKLDDI